MFWIFLLCFGGKQYLIQALFIIKGRFKAHFYSIEKPNLLQVIARHFLDNTHNDILDVNISALEFMHKAPRIPASSTIYDGVE